MSITIFIEDQPDEYGNYEVNMSNGNAMAVLQQIGLGHDYCGEVPVGALPSYIKKLQILLNTNKKDVLVTETVVDRTPGMATMYTMGRTDEYVSCRLEQLLNLFVAAKRINRRIIWC